MNCVIFIKRMLLLSIVGMILILLVHIIIKRPIITGDLTKQTVYLTVLNSFHYDDENRIPQYMLIDDDSGEGIFKVYEICEKLGVKATFAVVPSYLDKLRCDSLKHWHEKGYGIALHGYNHGRWKDWSAEAIVDDINRSLLFLEEKSIITRDQVRIVVTPGFYNTYDIRMAISSKGMKMVMGANIVNPDTTTFQWGRMFITQDTDLAKVYSILSRVKKEKGFIILGTHSSNPNEFSAEKTETILRVVHAMGFMPYQ